MRFNLAASLLPQDFKASATSSQAGKGGAHPGRRTSLAARKQAARGRGCCRLPAPRRPRPDSRETRGGGERCEASRKWAGGPVSSHRGRVLSRSPGVEGLLAGPREAESPRSSRPLASSLDPAPATAAPPFALHGARPSLSAASFYAWAACLLSLAVSSPDS